MHFDGGGGGIHANIHTYIYITKDITVKHGLGLDNLVKVTGKRVTLDTRCTPQTEQKDTWCADSNKICITILSLVLFLYFIFLISRISGLHAIMLTLATTSDTSRNICRS